MADFDASTQDRMVAFQDIIRTAVVVTYTEAFDRYFGFDVMCVYRPCYLVPRFALPCFQRHPSGRSNTIRYNNTSLESVVDGRSL